MVRALLSALMPGALADAEALDLANWHWPSHYVTIDSERKLVDYATVREPLRAGPPYERSRSMSQHIRFVGLDVHSDAIAIAIADPGDPGDPVKSVAQIPNDEALIRKWMKRLGTTHDLRVCYEAGPGGFVLYWQLTRLGVPCTVIAPTLIPRTPW